jgi:phytoene synthase
MSVPVSESITRQSASNLALAFVLLPREKRCAMATLYAFCREVDDVADDVSVPPEERRSRLQAWRSDLEAAFAQRPTSHPVMRELAPVIAHYQLPCSLFEELLAGVGMDLDVQRYPDYAALEVYCYRVASVVGLLSIEIFGYRNPDCREYAVCLGKALQLTNILRDVGTDADRGRIYLPLDELTRCEVLPDEIFRRQYSPRFHRLAGAVAQRARAFYRQARQSLPPEDRRSMIAAELMGAVYWRLLLTLERLDFQVLGSTPIRLSRAQKLLLTVRTWSRLKLGSNSPGYGVP